MSPGFNPEISHGPEPEIPPDILVPENMPPEPEDKKVTPEPVGERFAADEEQWFEQGDKGEAEEFKAPKFSVEEEEWFEQGKTEEAEDFTAPEEESAEEAELRELEEESEIRRVRDWAEREAQSTEEPDKPKPEPEPEPGSKMAISKAGLLAGVMALFRLPKFLVKKFLSGLGNIIDKTQKKVGGPVNQVIEKLTEKEEGKKK